MISDIAQRNFDNLWDIFDRKWGRFGGTVFRVHPFQRFFSRDFARNLTQEKAKTNLRRQLQDWGEFAQREELFEEARPDYLPHLEIPEDAVFPVRPKMEPGFARQWWFIVGVQHNLRCLSYHRMTIEEKIHVAYQFRHHRMGTNEDHKALYDLLRISKSFLLAEWAQDMILKAVSNDDHAFFQNFSNALAEEEIPAERSGTARTWFGVMLLWHLGGKDLKPRRKFMNLLRQKSVLSAQMEEPQFRSMLTKLKLTKKLTAEN